MDIAQQSSGSDEPISQSNWNDRGRAILIGFGLVVAAIVTGSLLSIAPITLGGTSFAAIVAVFVLSEAGYALVGWVYLRNWFSETVPIELPTFRQMWWVIVSTLVMLAIAMGVGVISTHTGIQLGRADQELIAGSQTMVLVMAVLSPILIAPAEEYLFRGVIQRRLAQSMHPRAAIFVASLLFVIPHAIGYLGGVQGILLLSVVPFLLAVLMGILYEKFDNLTVPILAHGFYNATLFGTTYFTGF
ncbi:CPBP family intramembrane glutamic endopeptidase [Halocatena marina]|uniref:CPBP family intramembrane glutamic endopeptidase n=2 Tax=Halocatena marina TaxID=2934937 RepID=A0ABD5YR36_9EURY|nr:type II CAAX endopeptidase family protein [Halocatena marina]